MGETGDAMPAGGDRVVPEPEWAEALSRFTQDYARSRVSVEIQESDGRREPLASEKDFELALIDVTQTAPSGNVRLVVHRHPGARIETVEVEAPVHIVQSDGRLSVEAGDGRMVHVEAIPPEPRTH